jgi:hypothetical protein
VTVKLRELASIQDLATELLVLRALTKSNIESLSLRVEFADTSVVCQFGDDRVCEIDDIVEGFREISATPGHELFETLSTAIARMLCDRQDSIRTRLTELGVDPSRIEDA